MLREDCRCTLNGSQHNFLGLNEKNWQIKSSAAEVMFLPKFHFSCDYSVTWGFETVKNKFHFDSLINFTKQCIVELPQKLAQNYTQIVNA